MSSVELLDKTRKINRLLHNNKTTKVVFNDICTCLGALIDSNAFVLSKKGKILGRDKYAQEHKASFFGEDVGEFISNAVNTRFLEILSTQENVNTETLGLASPTGEQLYTMVAPLYIAGERLGTLVVFRTAGMYSIDDIILCEYTTTVVGLEMIRSLTEEDAEETRREQVVRSAASSLSASELRAMKEVLTELDGEDGTIVASRIASTVGITRSVIVNGLRKLESAGVIECHSSGMKGTFVKILNKDIYEEMAEKKV
ncbi:MAG: GTP-sensing pleiotropic transcriptional regulator CodY [Lachnospiraceae bacterium]|nr:GTP-sensing pleiotropic transcriptional regulator CodY [Lachnospiraceae bacterium]